MLTTLVVGAQLYDNFLHGLPAFTLGNELMPLFHPQWIWQQPGRLLRGIPFSVSLMAILLAHEMGHFAFCEKYEVNATLPFFIPAPTLIGTMGAFIRIKSPIRSRRELFDIGVAGPIAGFVVALPLLFLGLSLSKPLGPTLGRESLDIGFPAVFHLAHWILTPAGAKAVPLGSTCIAPDCRSRLGGNVCHRPEPAARRPTRRGTSHLCGCAPGPQMGDARKRRVVGLAFVFMDWLAGLGGNTGVTGWRHPAVPAWPDLGRKATELSLVPVLLLALTFVPAPILARDGSSKPRKLVQTERQSEFRIATHARCALAVARE